MRHPFLFRSGFRARAQGNAGSNGKHRGQQLLSIYQGTTSDTSTQTTYTFTSQAIGTADANRTVIAAFEAASGSFSFMTGCTIGGVTASRAGNKQGGSVSAEIWYATVPTGTTATITATFNTAQSRCAVAVYTTIGAVSVFGCTGNILGYAPNAGDVTINTSPRGFIVCAAQGSSTLGVNLVSRNMTEDSDASYATNTEVSFSHVQTTSTTTTVGVDCNSTGGSPNGNSPVLFVAFGPSPGGTAILDGLSPTGAFSLSRSLYTGYQGPTYDLTSGAISKIYSQVSHFNLDAAGPSHVTDGSSSARRPALSTAGPSSVACADFDGSSDYLEGIALNNYVATGAAWIVVSAIFDVITTSLGTSATGGHALVTDTLGHLGIYANDDSGTKKTFAANYVTGSADMHVGQATTAGTAYVFTLRHESGTLYVSINGGAETSVASGNTNGLTGLFRFGVWTSSSFFDGKLFECAVFNSVPSLSDRNAIIADFKSHIGA